MAIYYKNLETNVRNAMVSELESDITSGNLYISPRLTGVGAKEWPQILRKAFEEHCEQWIMQELRSKGLMRLEEQRRKLKGGFTMARIPGTAPDTLAEGEFNRFYVRGLCLDILASGGTETEVYRGKEVQNPRSESQAMIGRRFSAQQLLNDLRNSQGVEPALGLPPGPNSGLTVCRV